MPLSKSAIIKKAKKIKLLAMDVDGVLTDGSIILLESGEEVKAWHVRDRIAFFMIDKSPRPFLKAWITGRKSRQVEARARELRLDALYQKCEDKGLALKELAEKFRLSLDQILFVGDDLVDLPALRLAGLAVSPADACPEAKALSHWVTEAPGGRGVFREVVDAVLKAQGLWKDVINQFEHPRS